jgi:hypothetical protein
MLPITSANQPNLTKPFRRAFIFIWKTQVTKSGRSAAVYPSCNSDWISGQLGLVNVKKTSGIPNARTIAMAS